MPYKMISVPDPVCWTEAPETLGNLAKQRNRWQRVIIETFLRNLNMTLNPKYGSVGVLGMGYYLFYEILGPFVEIASYSAVVLGAFYGYVKLNLFLSFLVLLIFYNAFLTISAVFMQNYGYRIYSLKELARLIISSLAEHLGYHTYLTLVRIKATFDIFNNVKSWHKFERIDLRRRHQ